MSVRVGECGGYVCVWVGGWVKFVCGVLPKLCLCARVQVCVGCASVRWLGGVCVRVCRCVSVVRLCVG